MACCLQTLSAGGGWAGQLAVPDNSARPLRFRATFGSGVRGPWFDLISNKGGQTIKGTLTATGGFKGNVEGNTSSATKWNGAAKTVSTAMPSGGADGDIWFRYTA